MRRSQVRTAVVFATQSLVLLLALTLASVPAAHADEVSLATGEHVRAAAAGRGAFAPGGPSNSGDQSPLPTPVKPPRTPRVPPVWNPFNGPGLVAGLVQAWTGAQSASQSTSQLAASRMHAQ